MALRNLKLYLSLLPILTTLFCLIFSPWTFFSNKETILCLNLAFWMISWWVINLLPLGVTALIPLFYLPVLQLFPIKQISTAYTNPVIFLFLGGFVIARALEKTKLDERIALNILRLTGRSDKGILLGFIISTAGLSMWISNTATTVMMVPIALSVVHFLEKQLDNGSTTTLKTFSLVLFLCIAYSANIGGITTPIGTPPNVVFMGYLNDIYNQTIDFYKWMFVATPVALALLVIMYFLIPRIYSFEFKIPENFQSFLDKKIKELGKLNNQQRLTIRVFFLAAFLWSFKSLIHSLVGINFLNDTSIAIFSAILLFLIPVKDNKKWQRVLVENDLQKLPWNIVLLFGGGMALAGSLKDVGVIEAITNSMASFYYLSPYILIFMIAGIALFLTEVMSNVALCVVALPIIMKLGESLDINPILIAMPAALCTSFAFCMPISTPPNAIVFGTNRVSIAEMMKAGIILNILALCITMSLGYFVISKLLLM